MKIARWIAAGLLTLSALGCGNAPVEKTENSSPQSGPNVALESAGDATTPTEDRDNFPIVNTPALELPVSPDSAPEEVVAEFLNAMKTGNDGVAAGLLTATARQETAKFGLAVQPPGSAEAQYEVTQGEISAEDPNFAQVGCLWTETDADGKPHSEEVAWVLTKVGEGWRVSGMIAQSAAQQDPIYFNFENGAEMTALIDQLSGGSTPEAEAAIQEQPEGLRSAKSLDEGENSLRK